MSGTEYDMSNLDGAFAALEPKRRLQAIRGGLRGAGRQIRKKAVARLRQTLKSSPDLERGMRVKTYRKAVGVRVTIGGKPPGSKGGGRRRSFGKPVLVWAESGTKRRFTKTRTKIWVRKRRSHSTGRLEAGLFMQRAQRDVAPDVDRMVKDEVGKYVAKVIRKYGSK